MTLARHARRSIPALLAFFLLASPLASIGADRAGDSAGANDAAATESSAGENAPTGKNAKAPQPAAKTGGTTARPDSTVEEVLVTGTSVTDAVDQARFSTSVVDVLSSKDFAVTGDTGVVSAAGRISGVTTVDDKYVYVRGLGDRYSSSLFNGAVLPSTDPLRRVVPLDLFPAAVMDQISVQKTYSPDLPADFAGGSVQMRTRSVPAEREAKMSLTTEVRPGTTFAKHETIKGSNSDWTGYDGNYRHLPTDFPNDATTLNSSTPAQKQAFGLELHRAFDTSNNTLAPNLKLKGSYADNTKLYRGKIGYLVGGQAENRWASFAKQTATARGNGSVSNHSVEDTTINSINYSGLGGLEWEPTRSDAVSATLFYTHNTRKRYIQEPAFLAENYSGSETDLSKAPPNVIDYISEWEEQALWTAQLFGQHNLPRIHNADLDWGVTYSTASRVKPDSRDYRYDIDEITGEKNFQVDNGNQFTWESLTDNAWDAHVDGSMPFKVTQDILSSLKIGARYYDKERDSKYRSFRFNPGGGKQYGDMPITDIFADPNISPFQWKLQESTLGGSQYSASESIVAGFLQSDTDFGSRCHWMVGTRYESSTQEVTVPGSAFFPYTRLENAGFRPATELTWMFRDDLQLRGAFSQTINRPDLRELAVPQFIYQGDDDQERRVYFGNPNLKVAKLLNYDLRLEWYHHGADHVQLAGFYKDITSPIELRKVTSFRTWANSKSAVLYGMEFEVRQGLYPLGRWADDFYVRTNVSWIHSEAKTDDAGIAPHPLQGQSPWITNFQLTWDNLPTETQATLAFNMAGKRLSDVGQLANSDPKNSFVQPRPVLDFVLSHAVQIFGYDLDLTFKAKNLINSKYENTRDGVVETSYRPGRLFSLEIGKDF